MNILHQTIDLLRILSASQEFHNLPLICWQSDSLTNIFKFSGNSMSDMAFILERDETLLQIFPSLFLIDITWLDGSNE